MRAASSENKNHNARRRGATRPQLPPAPKDYGVQHIRPMIRGVSRCTRICREAPLTTSIASTRTLRPAHTSDHHRMGQSHNSTQAAICADHPHQDTQTTLPRESTRNGGKGTATENANRIPHPPQTTTTPRAPIRGDHIYGPPGSNRSWRNNLLDRG